MNAPLVHAHKFGLTPKQRDALDAIEWIIFFNGVSPSCAELAEVLGMKSRRGAGRLVEQLVARGHVRRGSDQARSIQIVEGLAP